MQRSMVAPEDETEAEVRREDQNNINRFARLNARLHQVRQESQQVKKDLDALDDASTELMMTSGSDAILLLTGEAFLETSEEDATEYCESMVEKLQKQHDALQQEADTIVEEQNKLKVVLYARFGKSIHLEDDDDQGDK